MSRLATSRAELVLHLLEKERVYPPSIREIGRAMKEAGFSDSTSLVRRDLKNLEQMGITKLTPRVSRGIELLKPRPVETPTDFVFIPLIGRLVANEPIPGFHPSYKSEGGFEK